MKPRFIKNTLVALIFAFTLKLTGAELVYLDEKGVIRWNKNHEEIALFGANYCLPSACDYRAAGYVNADRKKLVEKDLLHFARMGWDGMRLCFWGDWENCDTNGNLIVNDHLDLMDYAIAQARKRGIYILFTPITTYAAWWPDGRQSDDYPGFSKAYERSQLGVNPDAIRAQSNYIHQILNHVNPYTGVALKDEPNILLIEMINEPVHRPDNLTDSINYINTLADAVLSTGCRKILFHNVSQDFRITPAIKASKVQGVTFAWYPTGLNADRALTENYLRTVDDYPPMLRPDLLNVPKLVYEFDSADVNSGYMYPAMVRAFRGVGAQFMAMFSYDMVDTAPYNLGWQTHFLNLVYSPRKAMSAIIAAEAARELPRYSRYGDYPDNRSFGPFRVSYEEDTSEMMTDEKFLYANDTGTVPRKPDSLRKIAGVGSSPIVDYEGCGTYFLDRLSAGVWRLEVNPDAVIVQDPFAQKQNFKTVSSRLIWREWPMTVQLPDLGSAFHITPLKKGNTHASVARNGKFQIKPGVYLLSTNASPDRRSLPESVGNVGMNEFVCPAAPDLPAQIIIHAQENYVASQPAVIAADVLDSVAPQSVTLFVRTNDSGKFNSFPMDAQRSYRHQATIPAGMLNKGAIEFYLKANTAAGEIRFPPAEGSAQRIQIVSDTSPLCLFAAEQDIDRLVFTRIGDGIRRGIFQRRSDSGDGPAALRLFFPLSHDRGLDDYTASVSVKARITERGSSLDGVTGLRLRARCQSDKLAKHLTLVERDGTSWSAPLTLSTNWQEQVIPLSGLKLARGVELPLGFPGRWNYWVMPTKSPGDADRKIGLANVEHLQISFRPNAESRGSNGDPWLDVNSVELIY